MRSFQQRGYGKRRLPPTYASDAADQGQRTPPPQKAAVRETGVIPTPPPMAPEQGFGNGGEAPSSPHACL